LRKRLIILAALIEYPNEGSFIGIHFFLSSGTTIKERYEETEIMKTKWTFLFEKDGYKVSRIISTEIPRVFYDYLIGTYDR